MKATSTIPQFCDQHNISRSFFYGLLKQGKGPRVMKLGRRTVISAEAAAEWRKQVEMESDSNKPGIMVL